MVTPVTVLVTGIVAPVDPASSFWGIDPGVLAADLQTRAGRAALTGPAG